MSKYLTSFHRHRIISQSPTKRSLTEKQEREMSFTDESMFTDDKNEEHTKRIKMFMSYSDAKLLSLVTQPEFRTFLSNIVSKNDENSLTKVEAALVNRLRYLDLQHMVDNGQSSNCGDILWNYSSLNQDYCEWFQAALSNIVQYSQLKNQHLTCRLFRPENNAVEFTVSNLITQVLLKVLSQDKAVNHPQKSPFGQRVMDFCAQNQGDKNLFKQYDILYIDNKYAVKISEIRENGISIINNSKLENIRLISRNEHQYLVLFSQYIANPTTVIEILPVDGIFNLTTSIPKLSKEASLNDAVLQNNIKGCGSQKRIVYINPSIIILRSNYLEDLSNDASSNHLQEKILATGLQSEFVPFIELKIGNFVYSFQRNAGMNMANYIENKSIDIIELKSLIEAISKLREWGFFYGDIKPENIVIDNIKKIRLIDYDSSYKPHTHVLGNSENIVIQNGYMYTNTNFISSSIIVRLVEYLDENKDKYLHIVGINELMGKNVQISSIAEKKKNAHENYQTFYEILQAIPTLLTLLLIENNLPTTSLTKFIVDATASGSNRTQKMSLGTKGHITKFVQKNIKQELQSFVASVIINLLDFSVHNQPFNNENLYNKLSDNIPNLIDSSHEVFLEQLFKIILNDQFFTFNKFIKEFLLTYGFEAYYMIDWDKLKVNSKNSESD